MIDQIRYFLDIHRTKILAILASIVITALVFGGASYYKTHKSQQDLQVHDATSEAEQQSSSEETKQTTDSNIPLSDAQKQLISQYDEQNTALLKGLSAFIWVNPTTGLAIEFTDKSYITVMNGKQQPAKSFAIAAQSGISNLNLDPKAPTENGTVTLALLDEQGKTYVLSIARNVTTTEESSQVNLQMTTDMFSGQPGVYKAQERTNLAQIEGVDERVSKTIGKDLTPLRNALIAEVKRAYPTATKATYDQTLTIDFQKNVVYLSFVLNDTYKSKLTLAWHLDNDTVEFGDKR